MMRMKQRGPNKQDIWGKKKEKDHSGVGDCKTHAYVNNVVALEDSFNL